jgi:hypothetical protein
MLGRQRTRTLDHPRREQIALYMQAPMNRAMHPQAPADVQHGLPIFERHEGHDIALHAPPPEPDEEELGIAQLPMVQTWLIIVQLLHN